MFLIAGPALILQLTEESTPATIKMSAHKTLRMFTGRAPVTGVIDPSTVKPKKEKGAHIKG